MSLRGLKNEHSKGLGAECKPPELQTGTLRSFPQESFHGKTHHNA
jgi:hypothetical protein